MGGKGSIKRDGVRRKRSSEVMLLRDKIAGR